MSSAPLKIIMPGDPVATAPKKWLVRGVLGLNEVTGLIGASFVGKSILATDLCGSVARGLLWFGYPTIRGCALYIALERSHQTVARLTALRNHHGLDRLDVGVVPDRIDLARSPKDADRIIATMKRLEDDTGQALALLSIDTVSQAMAGADENSPTGMGTFVANVQRIREQMPVHVLLIHHPAKGGRSGDARGHTSLPGLIDNKITLSKSKRGLRWSLAQANDLPEAELPIVGAYTLTAAPIGAGMSAPIVVPLLDRSPATVPSEAPEQASEARTDEEVAREVLARLAPQGAQLSKREVRDAIKRALGAHRERPTDGALRSAVSKTFAALERQRAIVSQDDGVTVTVQSIVTDNGNALGNNIGGNKGQGVTVTGDPAPIEGSGNTPSVTEAGKDEPGIPSFLQVENRRKPLGST